MNSPRIFLFFLLFAIAPAAAISATIYVPDDFPTIQGAINAAKGGDTVIVRAGTYVENISFRGKAITLESEKGPEETIIDGGRKETVVLFKNGEGRDSVLEGFTITNGRGSFWPSYGNYLGGGIRCQFSSPTITGNIIRNNSVLGICPGHGGGIYCWDSAPLICNNVIKENAAWEGGGIAYSYNSPEIKNNEIVDNLAWNGGALSIFLDSSTIENNFIAKNYANYVGGGIALSINSKVQIRSNIISDNHANSGAGGIYGDRYSSPVIANNIICNNSAAGNQGASGGGIGIGNYCNAKLINNTIINNHADYGGGGVGFSRRYNMIIVNTIIWGNQAPKGPQIWLGEDIFYDPATITILYSDVEGGKNGVYQEQNTTLNWGPGMIDADPLFGDESGDDFHLQYGSPCRDAGMNHSLLPKLDFEGDPRAVQGAPDMGADEFYYHLYFMGDAYPGGNIAVKAVGAPGMAVTLALGTSVLDPAVSTRYGDLFLALPPLRMWNLGAIPATGILSRPSVVPSFWSPGSEHPLQALIGLPGGPYTHLTNLMVLEAAEEGPPLTEYKYDDGTCEDLYGLKNGGDMCWLQKYDTIPGCETIVSVDQIYGSYAYPGVSPGNGTPCEVFVWDDPTNDGDPSDCVLLAREPTTVQNVDKNMVTVIPLSFPVTVSGEFYVGCVMTHKAGQYCAPADSTTSYVSGRTFFCGTDTPGAFNPANLAANQYPPSDAGVYMCIRAAW